MEPRRGRAVAGRKKQEAPEEIKAVLEKARGLCHLELMKFEAESIAKAQWYRRNILTHAERTSVSGLEVVTVGNEVRVVKWGFQ